MKRTLGIQSAIVAAAIAVTATITSAESIWVKSESVTIRAGKGAIYQQLAVVKRGQELTVLAHDGSWLKVAVPGAGPAAPMEGWVFEAAVSPTKVDTGGINLAGQKTGTDMTTAAAGKGLNPSAEGYATTKGLSSAPLNNLIAVRNQLDPAEWERFRAEGHVGGH